MKRLFFALLFIVPSVAFSQDIHEIKSAKFGSLSCVYGVYPPDEYNSDTIYFVETKYIDQLNPSNEGMFVIANKLQLDSLQSNLQKSIKNIAIQSTIDNSEYRFKTSANILYIYDRGKGSKNERAMLKPNEAQEWLTWLKSIQFDKI